MSHETITPEGVFDSRRFGFAQAVEAAPGPTLYLSGQGGFDAEFQLVGEALSAQTEQALENIRHTLAAAGATPADVTLLRIYVVDYQPEDMGAIGAPLAKFFGDAPPCAQTLIGVQTLAMPGMRVEIEATAVLSGA